MNKIEEVTTFLKEAFPNDKKQMFNTRNIAGDPMVTIYRNNGVIIDYCAYYNYIEIFGLTESEFKAVKEECGYDVISWFKERLS